MTFGSDLALDWIGGISEPRDLLRLAEFHERIARAAREAAHRLETRRKTKAEPSPRDRLRHCIKNGMTPSEAISAVAAITMSTEEATRRLYETMTVQDRKAARRQRDSAILDAARTGSGNVEIGGKFGIGSRYVSRIVKRQAEKERRQRHISLAKCEIGPAASDKGQ